MGVFFERVQRASVFLGRLVSQLYPLMILLIFAVVVLRYFFVA